MVPRQNRDSQRSAQKRQMGCGASVASSADDHLDPVAPGQASVSRLNLVSPKRLVAAARLPFAKKKSNTNSSPRLFSTPPAPPGVPPRGSPHCASAAPSSSPARTLPPKLNLGAVQGKQEANETALRKEKLARFEHDCTRIEDFLYVSGDKVARNRELLLSVGITHILNCAGLTTPNCFPGLFAYTTLYVNDAAQEDISCFFYDAVELITKVKSIPGGKILVHCTQGVSRSVSMCLAYYMLARDIKFDDALAFVKERRGIAAPNTGFACQLMLWHKRHTSPYGEGLPLLYTIQPYDRDRPDSMLVAQIRTSVDAHRLVSSQAAVLQHERGLYVWRRRGCSDSHMRLARVHAERLMRYEKAPTPVFLIQGDETPEFLALIGEASGDMAVDVPIQTASPTPLPPPQPLSQPPPTPPPPPPPPPPPHTLSAMGHTPSAPSALNPLPVVSSGADDGGRLRDKSPSPPTEPRDPPPPQPKPEEQPPPPEPTAGLNPFAAAAAMARNSGSAALIPPTPRGPRRDPTAPMVSGKSMEMVEEEDSGADTVFEPVAKMFSLPDWEEIDNFDSDDLWEDRAFLLHVDKEKTNGDDKVFVWFGRDYPGCVEGDVQQVSAACVLQFKAKFDISSDVEVNVMLDGEETDEFWELFQLG